MFTKKIIDSDPFLEMPLSTQALYFHLAMRADDDGFVNSPKKIARTINATDDDLRLLITKRFILAFESGVIVIKHWWMHNTLKSDRYHPTDYQEEYAMLGIKPNKSYTDDPSQMLPPKGGTNMEPERNQDGTKMEPQNRLDKIREDKDSLSIDQERIDEEEEYEEEPNGKPVLLPEPEPGHLPIPDKETIDHWGSIVWSFMQQKRDPSGMIQLAANKGVTKQMLRDYVKQKQKEQEEAAS